MELFQHTKALSAVQVFVTQMHGALRAAAPAIAETAQ